MIGVGVAKSLICFSFRRLRSNRSGECGKLQRKLLDHDDDGGDGGARLCRLGEGLQEFQRFLVEHVPRHHGTHWCE